jgi:hypothetical protein
MAEIYMVLAVVEDGRTAEQIWTPRLPLPEPTREALTRVTDELARDLREELCRRLVHDHGGTTPGGISSARS